MKHGSLFSGIGGFDLAAEWMGWENKFHCEWNEFGQKILNYYWPNAISYGDITKTDFNVWRGKIDIITGGFPCQPYSQAGKQKGKADNRHLWPEMLRAIRQIQPSWIVGENVPGLLNWERGMVLDEIKTDLESAGFELLPPCILPACGKDAPHRRERLWIMAYCNTPTDTEIHRDRRNTGTMGETQAEPKSQDDGPEFNGSSKDVANADERRLQREAENRELGRERFMFSTSANKQQWENFPTQSPLCSRNDGLPTELAGITIPKHRTESIKGYGNAIVPQVAFEIFKAIEKTYEL